MQHITQHVFNPTSRADFIKAFKSAKAGDLIRVGADFWELLPSGRWWSLKQKKLAKSANQIDEYSFELMQRYFPEEDPDRRRLKKALGLLPDYTLASVPYRVEIACGQIVLRKCVDRSSEYRPFSCFYSRSPALTKTTGSDRDELMFGSIHVMN